MEKTPIDGPRTVAIDGPRFGPHLMKKRTQNDKINGPRRGRENGPRPPMVHLFFKKQLTWPKSDLTWPKINFTWPKRNFT